MKLVTDCRNLAEDVNKIISVAESLLRKNNISLPKEILFYCSLGNFIKKIIPEVEYYGFDETTSSEIIKCALNNGTYGTIDFYNNSVIEFNFNPFNEKGEYDSLDFLEMIIHESLHLHLSKSLGKDINRLKFKFEGEKFVGNEKIIQIDEGYAEFMTARILNETEKEGIKNIKIPPGQKGKPPYKKRIGLFEVDKFDRNFERLILSNRQKGFEIFESRFKGSVDNEAVLEFAEENLKGIL